MFCIGENSDTKSNSKKDNKGFHIVEEKEDETLKVQNVDQLLLDTTNHVIDLLHISMILSLYRDQMGVNKRLQNHRQKKELYCQAIQPPIRFVEHPQRVVKLVQHHVLALNHQLLFI